MARTAPLERLEKGVKFARKGDLIAAIDCFSEVIEANPEFTAAYNNRGISYASQGEYEKAIEYFKKVIEIATSDEQRHIDFSKKMIKELSE